MDIFYHFPEFFVGRILLLRFTMNLFFSKFDQICVFSCAYMCYFHVWSICSYLFTITIFVFTMLPKQMKQWVMFQGVWQFIHLCRLLLFYIYHCVWMCQISSHFLTLGSYFALFAFGWYKGYFVMQAVFCSQYIFLEGYRFFVRSWLLHRRIRSW